MTDVTLQNIKTRNVITFAAKCNNLFDANCNNFSTQNVTTSLTRNAKTQNVITLSIYYLLKESLGYISIHCENVAKLGHINP